MSLQPLPGHTPLPKISKTSIHPDQISGTEYLPLARKSQRNIFATLGIICAILLPPAGIVLSILGYLKSKRTFVGNGLSIIGLSASVVMLIVYLLIFANLSIYANAKEDSGASSNDLSFTNEEAPINGFERQKVLITSDSVILTDKSMVNFAGLSDGNWTTDKAKPGYYYNSNRSVVVTLSETSVTNAVGITSSPQAWNEYIDSVADNYASRAGYGKRYYAAPVKMDQYEYVISDILYTNGGAAADARVVIKSDGTTNYIVSAVLLTPSGQEDFDTIGKSLNSIHP